MPIYNHKDSYERPKVRRIPDDINLSALEVDRINRTTPKLTGEERRLERMYERPVNDSELWKKIVK